MEVKNTTVIDLEKYGVEGQIVLGAPTFRTQNTFKNEFMKLMTVSQSGDISDLPGGDLEILSMLVYVRSAPFKPTVEGFLRFCDTLDGFEVGRAERLYDELCEAKKVYDEGSERISPFVVSAGAGTESSE